MQNTEADPTLTTIPIRRVHIDVLEGPDAGTKATVTTPLFVVGTGDLVNLRLADSTVSREHLRLRLASDGVEIIDDGSRNGTWISGVRVRQGKLTSGSFLLKLGSTLLRLQVETEVSDVEVSASGRFGDALGGSAAMRLVFGALERAAPTDLSILMEGESGVGKDVLARSIHAASKRKNGPFVTVDCGAISAGVLESELFGHVRGAFTGASADRPGLFQEAQNGTLFLDEIGELPIDLQPKLLRALEQREVRPVGSNRSLPVDVRVVAATNRDLATSIGRGQFREDLFYRLAVVRIHVPPLRDRPDDILPIARSFLCEAQKDPHATFPSEVEGMLIAYGWPGNVRELRNAVERFVALGASTSSRDQAARNLFGDGGVIGVEDLARIPYHDARQRLLDDFDSRYLKCLLGSADGVVGKAAEQSGLSRATLYRMLDRHKLRER